MTTPALPDAAEVAALADELLRDLTPHAGNPEAVTQALCEWLDDIDAGMLAAVCIRAVYRTFADCLTVTPLDQAPTGALALIAPQEDAA